MRFRAHVMGVPPGHTRRRPERICHGENGFSIRPTSPDWSGSAQASGDRERLDRVRANPRRSGTACRGDGGRLPSPGTARGARVPVVAGLRGSARRGRETATVAACGTTSASSSTRDQNDARHHRMSAPPTRMLPAGERLLRFAADRGRGALLRKTCSCWTPQPARALGDYITSFASTSWRFSPRSRPRWLRNRMRLSACFRAMAANRFGAAPGLEKVARGRRGGTVCRRGSTEAEGAGCADYREVSRVTARCAGRRAARSPASR